MSISEQSSQTTFLQGGSNCVLMLHGLGANALELQRLAKDLHASGFSVVIPCIEGYTHGTSSQPWSVWIDQVLEHIWKLEKEYATVSVVGLSMGAVLAMVAAQRHARPLAGLVLLSVSLAYDGWSMPWYRGLLEISAWLPFAKNYRMKESEPYGVKNEEMRALIKASLKSQEVTESGVGEIGYQLIKQGQFLMREARENAHAIDSSTLVIHAVDDEIVHIRNAEWVYRKISSEDKEIIYLGDSYHMITIDNERETVSQETIRFLKKSVNSQLDKPAFDVAPIKSSHIRRLLRKIQAQVFQI
jgi:carboxylesterase